MVFHAGPAYLLQRMPGPGPLRLGGRGQYQLGVLLKEHTTTMVASHSPVNTSKSTRVRPIKFLAEGNNNSRSVPWGNEPEILNNQSNTTTIELLLPVSKDSVHFCLYQCLIKTVCRPSCKNDVCMMGPATQKTVSCATVVHKPI